MKIVNKISSLVIFLLIAIAVNTLVGVRQLGNIGNELKAVVNKDITLQDIVSEISQYQLERIIVFDRMLSIAEEIGFQEISATRRNYLFDHMKMIKSSFEDLSATGVNKLKSAKNVIQNEIKTAAKTAVKEDLLYILNITEKIEKTYVSYDALMNEIYMMINTGSYQLSLDDLDRIQIRERNASYEMKRLMKEIQKSTQESLKKASRLERISQKILWMTFGITFLLGVVLTLVIIANIAAPLKQLVDATKKIGSGDFRTHTPVKANDEIGELSKAFNQMSEKLDEFKTKLEHKNKILEENLILTNAQKKEIEKINAEMDKFIHMISHDVRAPLSGIMGYAAYLEQHCLQALDEKSQRSLQGLRKGSERLSQLISDLLTITKISRMQHPFEETKIGVVLKEILEQMDYVIKNGPVEIVWQEGSFPVIVCDRVKIKEAFSNLVVNAIKFSKTTPSPRIEIGYEDSPREHIFFVRDNGIGIPKEHHHKVFEAFQRLHTDQYEGTGIGLGIVKTVVEDHHGRVWLESEEGRGASFFFSIPKNLS